MRKTDLKIGFLMADPFPIGGARTIRMTAYGKYLNRAGIFFKVYILKGTEAKGHIRNQAASGKFEGIPFEYVHGKTTWNIRHNKIVKLFLIVQGIFKAFRRIRKDKINTLIINSESPLYILSFYLFCRLSGIKFLAEKTEFPSHIKKGKSRFYGYCYDKLYICFDGLFVISQEIRDYLKSRVRKKCEIYYLPMLVDTERFDSIQEKPDLPYIAYCGRLDNDRDGIWDMFKAYALFSQVIKNVKFYFIGDCSSTPKTQPYLEYIKMQGLEEKIIFLGPKTIHEIPSLLYNARLLIMAPDKNFNSGGFPTKLGEYLATGKPVVVTKVSEIPLFLENEKTAFLAEPGNCKEIAECMIKVFRQPELAKAVGEAGKSLAGKRFHFPSYLQDFTDFLLSLHHRPSGRLKKEPVPTNRDSQK